MKCNRLLHRSYKTMILCWTELCNNFCEQDNHAVLMGFGVSVKCHHPSALLHIWHFSQTVLKWETNNVFLPWLLCNSSLDFTVGHPSLSLSCLSFWVGSNSQAAHYHSEGVPVFKEFLWPTVVRKLKEGCNGFTNSSDINWSSGGKSTKTMWKENTTL